MTEDAGPVEVARLEPLSRYEELRVWRSGILPGVDVLTALDSNRLWRWFHETYSICIIPPRMNAARVGGRADIVDWKYRGRHHVMRPGTVALMEPGEVHINTRNYSSADFYTLFIDPAVIAEAAGELSMRQQVHLRGAAIETASIRLAFQRAYDAIAQGLAPLCIQTRFAAAIRKLLRGVSEQRTVSVPHTHHRIAVARDYLQAHATERVQLDTLAKVSGISRYHLAHVFTTTYGLSPHAFQNELRVALVRKALRSGTPLKEIEVGFFDQSHLTRHFGRSVGLTPRRFATGSPTMPRFQ